MFGRKGFDAPFEALFLLPEAICKSCGTKIPPDTKNCPECGLIFRWSFREKIARTLIMAYVSREIAQQEAARVLADIKSRRWCRIHGFQRVLPLERNGVVREYCTHCLAHAMVQPAKNHDSQTTT